MTALAAVRNGAAAAEARLMRLATYAAVAVALILIVAKTAAWAATDSVSVLSSLLDSLLDAAASIVNMIAVRHALVPADAEHRFGHGKVESLAGLAQAAFIAGSALLLFLEAAHRLAVPQPVSNPDAGIAVMVLAIALTVGLVAFQRYVVRRTRSLAIRADELHYSGDLLLNGSVIASLVAASTLGWTFVDPVFGVGIGLFILWSAWRIARDALHALMDRELPEEDRARIRALALAHPEVRSVHDLRTRSSGPQIFVQFHLEMDGAMPLARAHEVADAVEAEIMAAFPNAEVIIHEDPAGITEPHRAQPA